MTAHIPNNALLVMAGPSGTGKSTWTEKRFSNSIISSDNIRKMLTGDEDNQHANPMVFELFYSIIDKRLKLGQLTVADSTALEKRTRLKLLEIAEKNNVPAYLFIMDTQEEDAKLFNTKRSRQVPEHVISRHFEMMKQLDLSDENWNGVHFVNNSSLIQIDMPYSITIPEPYWVVGDVHGQYDKLLELNDKISDPVIFVGDFCDRGPDSLGTLNYVMEHVKRGMHAILGNHDEKLARALKGNNVSLAHGLEETLKQFEGVETQPYIDFLESLPPYLVVNNNTIVTHAGIKENMIGRTDKYVINYCLHGKKIETIGDEIIREDWAQDYRGTRTIVYGHTAFDEVRFLNNTICVDTGAGKGGKLSAVCIPTHSVISV